MEGRKKEYEYEVKWMDKSFENNSWLSAVELANIVRYMKRLSG